MNISKNLILVSTLSLWGGTVAIALERDIVDQQEEQVESHDLVSGSYTLSTGGVLSGATDRWNGWSAGGTWADSTQVGTFTPAVRLRPWETGWEVSVAADSPEEVVKRITG